MSGDNLFYQYYDALFQRKDYAKETELVFLLSKQFGLGRPKKILEIGCGTGNHTVFLAKKRIPLLAVDIDPKMVKIAQEKLKQAGSRDVKIVSTPVERLRERGFDLTVALFNVVTYIPDTPKLTNFMHGVERCLTPGGIFVFDMWNGVAAIKDPPRSKITPVDYNGRKIKCILTAKTDFFDQMTTLNYQLTVRNNNEIEKDNFSFTQTLWTPMQVRAATQEAGLEVVLCSPFLEIQRRATDKDWKIMFCCRKPK